MNIKKRSIGIIGSKTTSFAGFEDEEPFNI